MTSAHEHHLAVSRTARYHTLGEPTGPVREAWVVLHGYGQLSAFFIRHFAPLDDGGRIIVAPEALNRYYLDETSWHGSAKARVGATWMTREDREQEIQDYVGYLDTLHEQVIVPRGAARLVVLGFSQGVATACRWLARGRVRPDLLVMWAGPLPLEIDAAAAAPLRATRIVRVLGDADEMGSPEAVDAENLRLRAMRLDAELVRFSGGHALDAAVLRSLAG